MSIATSLFSVFIHQNIKSTTGLNIYSILEERPKAPLKIILIDVDRLMLPRRPENLIFEHILSNASLYRCFFNIYYMKTYSYVVKLVDGNIKKQLQYLHKISERRPKNVWKLSLGEVHIMMFYGSSKNVNLTDSIKFITATFLKYRGSIQEAKTFGVILCLINFEEAFQGRPNCVLKWILHIYVLGAFPGRQF